MTSTSLQTAPQGARRPRQGAEWSLRPPGQLEPMIPGPALGSMEARPQLEETAERPRVAVSAGARTHGADEGEIDLGRAAHHLHDCRAVERVIAPPRWRKPQTQFIRLRCATESIQLAADVG